MTSDYVYEYNNDMLMFSQDNRKTFEKIENNINEIRKILVSYLPEANSIKRFGEDKENLHDNMIQFIEILNGSISSLQTVQDVAEQGAR